jgi:hypothetical protein
MGRKSAEATNARFMCPSLRFARAFFRAASAAFFDLADDFLADEDFLLDAWREKPAGTDTRSMRKRDRRRLTCTDFNFVENWRP